MLLLIAVPNICRKYPHMLQSYIFLLILPRVYKVFSQVACPKPSADDLLFFPLRLLISEMGVIEGGLDEPLPRSLILRLVVEEPTESRNDAHIYAQMIITLTVSGITNSLLLHVRRKSQRTSCDGILIHHICQDTAKKTVVCL